MLVSVGNDETMMLWNLDKKVPLVSKNLGTQATCIDFSPDGEQIIVGFINGNFMTIRYEQLQQLQIQKDSDCSIIAVKYS